MGTLTRHRGSRGCSTKPASLRLFRAGAEESARGGALPVYRGRALPWHVEGTPESERESHIAAVRPPPMRANDRGDRSGALLRVSTNGAIDRETEVARSGARGRSVAAPLVYRDRVHERAALFELFPAATPVEEWPTPASGRGCLRPGEGSIGGSGDPWVRWTRFRLITDVGGGPTSERLRAEELDL